MPTPKVRRVHDRFLPRSERRRPLRLHEVLRKEREAREYSQQDLALILGRPQSWIARIESGQTRLRADELREYAHALGVTVWRLLREAPVVVGRADIAVAS